METIQKSPTPNSYWVVPGQLLAGQHPAANMLKAQENLRQMLEANITVFIDLTREGEHTDYEYRANRESATLRKLIARYRIPIKDESVPTIREMTEILDLIDTAILAGRGVYVHSLHGRGRTGTVIGCYLVRHGKNGTEALAEITRLKKSMLEGGREDSPSTEEQRQMVLNWQNT
jgi:protein-tyrosine phosphatase